jgi:acetylornithine deacetylase
MLQLLLNITKKLESDALPAIYNIRDMHSADSGYAVPDRCTAWLDLHLPPKSPIGSITCELEELVYSLVRDRPGDPQTLAFDTIHSGFELPEKGYLPELLKQTFETLSMPWHSTFFPSHSDANLLWQAGVKPVMLGPGDLDRAHSEEESVPFAQVEQAAKLYYQVLIEQEKNRGT